MASERPSSSKALVAGSASTELSANRTAMAFQRTSMSIDRTLMSVIRTSLSLIGFGFTIYEAFRSLVGSDLDFFPAESPKRFGLALIVFGLLLLVLGLVDHWRQARSLNERRKRLHQQDLLHHGVTTKVSDAAVIALLLLLLGLAALARAVFGIGPLE